MSTRASEKEELFDSQAWMLTLSDLLLLLLTMFVMMLSMTTLESRKVPRIAPSLQSSGSAGGSSSSAGAFFASLDPAVKSGARIESEQAAGRPTYFTVSLDHAFLYGTSELTFDALEVVRATARSAKDGGLAVTAEISVPSTAGELKTAAFDRIVERSQVIFRQFLDAGVEREALRTRLSVTPMTPQPASEEESTGALRLSLSPHRALGTGARRAEAR